MSHYLLLWVLCEGWDQGHCYPQPGKSGVIRVRTILVPVQVYSVLGLLMVGTYNFGLDRQRLYERQMHGWPSNSNPSFHGVVDTRVINVGQGDFSLPVPPAVDAPVLEVEDIKDDDDDLEENEPGMT